jgi:hypothetical protein
VELAMEWEYNATVSSVELAMEWECNATVSSVYYVECIAGVPLTFINLNRAEILYLPQRETWQSAHIFSKYLTIIQVRTTQDDIPATGTFDGCGSLGILTGLHLYSCTGKQDITLLCNISQTLRRMHGHTSHMVISEPYYACDKVTLHHAYPLPTKLCLRHRNPLPIVTNSTLPL